MDIQADDNGEHIISPSRNLNEVDKKGLFMSTTKVKQDTLKNACKVIAKPLGAELDHLEGYVYAATSYASHHMPMIKIGFSEYDPLMRVRSIHNFCGVSVEHYMKTPRFKGAHRVEQIVLKLLAEMNIRLKYCTCQSTRSIARETEHHEWVQERPEWVAAIVLIVWQWMEHQEPYDFQTCELKTQWIKALKKWEDHYEQRPISPAEFFMMPPNSHEPLTWHFRNSKRLSLPSKTSQSESRLSVSLASSIPLPILSGPLVEQGYDIVEEIHSSASSVDQDMTKKHEQDFITVPANQANENVKQHEGQSHPSSIENCMSKSTYQYDVLYREQEDGRSEGSSVYGRTVEEINEIHSDKQPVLQRTDPSASQEHIQPTPEVREEAVDAISNSSSIYTCELETQQADPLQAPVKQVVKIENPHRNITIKATQSSALLFDMHTVYNQIRTGRSFSDAPTPSLMNHRKPSSVSTPKSSKPLTDQNVSLNASTTRSGRRYSPSPLQSDNGKDITQNLDPPTPTPISSKSGSSAASTRLPPPVFNEGGSARCRRSRTIASAEGEDFDLDKSTASSIKVNTLSTK